QDREALLYVSDPLPALDGALATCSARLRFLDPALERLGVGWGQRPSGERVTAFRFARASSSGGGRRDAELIYPADGQRDVPLSFPGNEVPDPIPQTARKVAGFPVTVTFPSGASISDATGRLLGGDGREVAAWFSSPEKPANPDFAGHQGTTLCLIARDVLQPGATYRVEVTARVDARPWSRSCRFTPTTTDRQTPGMAHP